MYECSYFWHFGKGFSSSESIIVGPTAQISTFFTVGN